MSFCSSCGKPVSGRFCGTCGGPAQESPPDSGSGSVQELYWQGQHGPQQSYPQGPSHAAPAEGYGAGRIYAGPGGHPPAEPVPPPHGNQTEPPPRRPGMLAGVLAGLVAVALVAVAGVFGYLWLTGKDDAGDTVASSGSASGPATGGEQPQGSTGTGDTGGGGQTTGALPPADQAEAELLNRRSTDVGRVSLDGRWVVQLASKYPGVTDEKQQTLAGSHVFELPDIKWEHDNLRARFEPDMPVYLLKATDFGKSSSPHRNELWVTLADPGLSSEGAARAACASMFPEKSGSDLENACLPRRLNPPS